jgi:Na+-driven multidrug efflux pump
MRAMRISILRLFVFYIPLAWITNMLWGLEGMFVAFVVANALTAFIAFRWVTRSLEEKANINQSS